MAYDVPAFGSLQSQLVGLWPALTVRTVPTRPRVILVLNSMTIDLPDHFLPMIPAYEERYLCFVLALARSENTRVIYVTSLPMLPRLANYYLQLVKDLKPTDAANRLTVVSVGDPSELPLSRKILDRPLLVRRLRELIGDPQYGFIWPFIVTELEAELAVALGIAIYGPDPALSHLGSKTGSREAFVAAGVPCPRGAGGLRNRDDIVDALLEIQRTGPVRRAVVKLDTGFSGLGNADIELGYADQRRDIVNAVDRLVPDDASLSAESFLAAFATCGGVAEEWIEGERVVSPSVQLRASPLGEVEVLSTHDQVLGGPNGQTYLGCRFPASPPLIEPLTRYGRSIGAELSRRGVTGRFAVDFIVTHKDGRWWPRALEINLRNGGTTHPAITLMALTDGTYDEESGQLLTRTGFKHYVATDHLEHRHYRRLTPDDVLDVVEAAGLGWDATLETGVALHMVSAVALNGGLGATAIANSSQEAERLLSRLRLALDQASGAHPTPQRGTP
ncbi:MAG: hypothetical protein H0V49_05645 [Nocardioidaceae bacterium]|nr:hypothetical protein [Nocardioidaceae bacterium]